MDQFDHGSAVDAIVRAGRSGNGGDSASGDAAERNNLTGKLRHADPRFAALLSRILAGITGTEAPRLQFVACGAQNRATTIAFQTAQVASSVLGRTLLLNARLDRCGPPIPQEAADKPVRDAFIPDLYHYELASRPRDIALLFGLGREATLRTLISPFHFVAVDCPAPSAGSAASAFAALCIGSILVVTAGSSTRESIRDASANITCAGGKIIGVVLADAPSDLPVWIDGL